MTDITLSKAKRIVELHSLLDNVRKEINKLQSSDNPMVSISVEHGSQIDKTVHSGRTQYDDIAKDVVRMLKKKYALRRDELIRELHQLGAAVPPEVLE